MRKHLITRAEIEAYCRGPGMKAWNDARAAARRRAWSVLDIEEVLKLISGGLPAGEAVERIRPGGYDSFHDIVISDPALQESYLKALKMRAMHVGEEVLGMADDDANDTLETGGKSGVVPNNANVNRAKLKVETRLKLMGMWFRDLYGDKPNVQVNVQVNHAERLEAARSRARTQDVAPTPRAEIQEAIEAAFREVPAPADDPLDTTWLTA
jgi:hypothetical protein